MKFHLYAMLFTAALTCPFLHASTLEARATVPFAFRIGKTVLPAGDYKFYQSRDVLTVSRAGKTGTMRITMPATRATVTAESQLLFTRYGGEFYLTNIWNAGSKEGRSLLVTKHEIALAQNTRKVETAGVSLRPASH